MSTPSEVLATVRERVGKAEAKLLKAIDEASNGKTANAEHIDMLVAEAHEDAVIALAALDKLKATDGVAAEHEVLDDDDPSIVVFRSETHPDVLDDIRYVTYVKCCVLTIRPEGADR